MVAARRSDAHPNTNPISRLWRADAHEDVGRGAWLVFLAIHDYVWRDSKPGGNTRTHRAVAQMFSDGLVIARLSQPLIARKTLMCEQQVRAELRRLEAAGWIRTHRISQREGLIYELGRKRNGAEVLYAEDAHAAKGPRRPLQAVPTPRQERGVEGGEIDATPRQGRGLHTASATRQNNNKDLRSLFFKEEEQQPDDFSSLLPEEDQTMSSMTPPDEETNDQERPGGRRMRTYRDLGAQNEPRRRTTKKPELVVDIKTQRRMPPAEYRHLTSARAKLNQQRGTLVEGEVIASWRQKYFEAFGAEDFELDTPAAWRRHEQLVRRRTDDYFGGDRMQLVRFVMFAPSWWAKAQARTRGRWPVGQPSLEELLAKHLSKTVIACRKDFDIAAR